MKLKDKIKEINNLNNQLEKAYTLYTIVFSKPNLTLSWGNEDDKVILLKREGDTLLSKIQTSLIDIVNDEIDKIKLELSKLVV